MKHKFNVFDVIIIALIIVAAVVGFKMLEKTGEDAAQAVSEVMFTVEIANCENDIASKIEQGDDIYDSVKGGYYGKVEKVETKPTTSVVANTESGKYVLVEYPNRSNVYVTVKGTPTSMTEGNIQFASQKVKVGTVAYLKSADYVGYGYVTDIIIAKEG